MSLESFAKNFMEAEHQAFMNGSFNLLEQIESPDIVIHMPPYPDFNGFAAHRQYIETARETMTDIEQEWNYVTSDGNVCVLSIKESLTVKAES